MPALLPNRFQGMPITLADGIAVSAQLVHLEREAHTVLASSFLTDENKTMIRSVLVQLEHWRTWVSATRPRTAELAIEPDVVERFDLLLYADYPDLAARVAAAQRQVRRRKLLLVGLPLAGLGGLYLLHRTAR